MITLFDNSTDVSAYLKERSVKITDQMGNRKNTAGFVLNDRTISQGRSVRIYETLRLRQSSSSGTKILYVDDTYPDTDKWVSGNEILVAIQTAGEMTYVIDTVDHSARTITLTTNLSANVTKDTTLVGRLLFGGVCVSNPDEEIGQSGKFSCSCKVVDWTYLYDRKIIAQQFTSMYAREIIGRISYFFCATDTYTDLDDFESAWTQGGVGNAMADSTTDRLHGSKAQKTSTSGAGTATWTKTITAKDISAYTHLRFWWKALAGNGGKMTSMIVRLGTDASNYFEYSFSNIGAAYEACWNYESVKLGEYDSITGSPSLASVQWIRIVVATASAMDANSLFFDNMFASTGGFTIQNVVRGDILFGDVRVQYKKASEITEEIAKQSGLFWYIDYTKDIHLFADAATVAPWGIDDTSDNYRDLSVETDISKLKNRQIVRGGEAASDTLYTQAAVADGSQTSFALDYKPSTLTMTVAGVPQTLGVEGFVDPTTVQWVYNFQEKVVRKGTASTPAAAAAIVFTYYPYQPIRVSVTSPTSIAAMQALTGGDGYCDGAVIDDSSLASFEDARALGRAQLTQWANAIVTVRFESDVDGLRAGQTISVVDTARGIDGDYLIQSVQWEQEMGDRWIYTVQASSTLFGLIEFIQMLLKRATRLDIEPSEIVDTILNVDETITLTPAHVFTALSKTVYAALKKTQVLDFVSLSGSVSANGSIDGGSQWYAEFSGSETGTAQFTTSRHSNNAELRLTTAVGGNGKELQVRTPFRLAAVPSTLYTVDAWTEILTALSNVGTGGGFQMVIKEWAAQTGGSVLATNTIFSAITSIHDFVKRSATFTTNASTAWISIEISIYRAIGTARITDVRLTPATAETATLAGQASFAQAT